MARNILQKDNLNVIRQNKSKIMRVLQEEFWEDLTFDDVEFMVKELAPLMKYFEPSPRKVVQIDAPDVVLSMEAFERKLKEDTELQAFIAKNSLVKSIRDGEGISARELQQLESQLTALRPELTIENVQKYQKKDFIVFLREMIGLTDGSDPKELIEQRFDAFIIVNSRYNSRQLEFLLLLKKVFSERKRIEIPDLAKSPLAEEHPLDYFTRDQLTMIVEQCNEIKIC
jgi:type I restriction enzyme R subunit